MFGYTTETSSPCIVSDSQAAFIPGRLISDNVMIAQELLHSLKSRKRVSQTYMAVKTDVSKAYDRVEWNFLETTMRVFGFSELWISWIMATVQTVNYSLLINGSPHDNIIPACLGNQARRPTFAVFIHSLC